MSDAITLSGRRFGVRFLGRPRAWLWLALTMIPFATGWALVALPARGSPGDERTWFLWSGNVLLALFIVAALFSARKWCIKLRVVRDMGRRTPEQTDAAWAGVQDVNRKVLAGAYASDERVLEAAHKVLVHHGVDRAQRATLSALRVQDRTVRVVRLVRREPLGRLEAWLEAHMGVGVTACLGVWLHADLMVWHHVGWALVTLSSLILISGVFGAVAYRFVPPALSRADPGIPYEEAGVARATYHQCVTGILATLDEPLRTALAPLRKTARSQAAIARRNAVVLDEVAPAHPESASLIRDLAVMAASRDRLREVTAPAVRLDRMLVVWKWIHIPLSLLLFGVIAVHVFQVIWY